MAHTMACSGCGAQLRVRDEYAGRAMKCPRCGLTLQPDAQADAPPVDPVPHPILETPTVLEPADDVPMVSPARRKQQNRWDSDVDVRRREHVAEPYAPCPKCGSTDAERVHFTFWGSFHITNMVCHVQCCSCGTRYNGRTGRSNLVVAILCILIPLFLIFVIVGLLAWWILIGSRNPRSRAEALPAAYCAHSSANPASR
jgi:predicted RNA-binding Zn-ribbon protein involved in translation (DUF1610 family)